MSDQELRREICRRFGRHDYGQNGECRTCFHVFPASHPEELHRQAMQVATPLLDALMEPLR